MANVLFSEFNYVDGATVSGEPAAGDLAVENVKDPRMVRRYRTSALSGQISAASTQNRATGVLAIRFAPGSEVPTTGTVRHVLATASSGGGIGGVVYDSGDIAIDTSAGYGYHLHVVPGGATAGIWTIYYDFSGSGLSFIDISRLWAGPTFRPDPNISYGYEDGWTDTSVVQQADRTGITFIDEGNTLRRYRVALGAMTANDRARARDLKRTSGRHAQVLFCLDPDNPAEETVIGRLQDASPIVRPDFPRYTTEFRILEDA